MMSLKGREREGLENEGGEMERKEREGGKEGMAYRGRRRQEPGGGRDRGREGGRGRKAVHVSVRMAEKARKKKNGNKCI